MNILNPQAYFIFQENLLLSIIPKNIATQVRDGIWGYIQKHKLNESRKPFKELFVEKHDTGRGSHKSFTLAWLSTADFGPRLDMKQL